MFAAAHVSTIAPRMFCVLAEWEKMGSVLSLIRLPRGQLFPVGALSRSKASAQFPSALVGKRTALIVQTPAGITTSSASFQEVLLFSSIKSLDAFNDLSNEFFPRSFGVLMSGGSQRKISLVFSPALSAISKKRKQCSHS